MSERTDITLYSKLAELREHLQTQRHRLVLAESCTSGFVAAELGAIPGISEHFCGSMVVYRTATKNAWLELENAVLFDPQIGPVSAIVTKQLAEKLMQHTPEATLAASITGHLGPNAPANLDGLVFCGLLWRDSNQFTSREFRLAKPPPQDRHDFAGRRQRQMEAAALLIDFLVEELRARAHT